MIRNINRDILSLGIKPDKATPDDLPVIADLKDTLAANADRCVGMAANMIGVHKNIIIVHIGISDMIMVNPVIVKKAKPYETEEGCLSLDGVRAVKRFQEIEVTFEDEKFVKRRRKFSGFIAQIIQHEIDHCSGIII